LDNFVGEYVEGDAWLGEEISFTAPIHTTANTAIAANINVPTIKFFISVVPLVVFLDDA